MRRRWQRWVFIAGLAGNVLLALLRAVVERIISSLSGAAMNGLSGAFFHADPEVVLEALSEWRIRTRDEPDNYLISLAIALYNDGNNTPERLLKALEIELVGDRYAALPAWNVCAILQLVRRSGF